MWEVLWKVLWERCSWRRYSRRRVGGISGWFFGVDLQKLLYNYLPEISLQLFARNIFTILFYFGQSGFNKTL